MLRSESSTLGAIRSARRSNKKALSSRIFKMARSRRTLRSRAASLFASISFRRRLRAMHLR